MEEKIKVLLCEDDENLGMLLREYLEAKDSILYFALMVKLVIRSSLRPNLI